MPRSHTILIEKSPAPRVRYEDDAFTWARQQAALLRAGQLDEVDALNIADEIEDVAGREYDKLESALARVFQHLLKWDHQPERRSRSWALTIEEHRYRVGEQLRRHPGLKTMLDRAVAAGYRRGRFQALKETELPRSGIPDLSPYDWDDLMAREIAWPDD